MISMRHEKLWKNELLKTANYILKLYSSEVSISQVFTLEKRIMICLLHIRQNINYYVNMKRKYPEKIELFSYPILDKKTDAYDFVRRYDLFHGKKERLRLVDLCHSFIHIEIKSDFLPLQNRIFGIFFSSDHKKNHCLYYLELCKFSQILFSLAKDEEIGIKPLFDKAGKLIKFAFSGKW